MSRYEEQDSFPTMMVVMGALAVVCLGLLGTAASSINTGNVGIVRHFGAIQSYVLPEGMNWTRPWPFANVEEISVKTGATSHDAAAASKDLQIVHTKVTIQWAPIATQVVCLVQRFGPEEAWTTSIMEPAILEVVKAVSARYTAEELITKRAEVHQGVEDGLDEFIDKTLADRDCVRAVRISNVAVTNFDFSPEFNGSIEAKVKAEQDALRAQNEKKKKITQAEADAKEKELAADANAYKTEVESKARAAAIQRESDALKANPEIVQLRVAERWNGVLPTYTGSTIPMLQLPNRGAK